MQKPTSKWSGQSWGKIILKQKLPSINICMNSLRLPYSSCGLPALSLTVPLSLCIPPRCLLFWLFLATYLTLMYSQARTHTRTQTHRAHEYTQSLRCCSCAGQGNRSNAASAFLYLKSAFIWQQYYHRHGCFDSDLTAAETLWATHTANKQSHPRPAHPLRDTRTHTTHEYLQILCSWSRQFAW